jgi:hypothetical protein
MRLRSWRCEQAPFPAPLPRRTPRSRLSSLPRRTPDERPAWATAPTEVFPTNDPGRAGKLTRAQEWRANGGRW